ncbi:MAG: cyclic nucleotide-binding domain-containing protein [Actinomycetota bacterium]
MGAYVFDNSWEKERERLAGLEAPLDPGTTRHMESIGVGPGWTCLEVAGGGGSIAQWLCAKVGPQGKVLATDINTRFLDALSEPNLEVRRHDITLDELPEQSFDLIHSRLLLEHLPARDVALKRMVSALKPGGWVMIEDLDWGPMIAKPPMFQVYPIDRTRRTMKVWRALLRVMQSYGYDEQFGRRLPSALTEEGLEDVGAEIRSFLVRGGDPGSAAPVYSLIQLRERLVEMGLLTNKEIDRQIEWLSDPNGFSMYPLMTATWGRKPGALAPTIKVQAMPERRERLVDRLRLVPLLEDVDESELVRIAPLTEELDVDSGDVLTEEGTPGADFFIILTGTATVERQGHKLATLGPGSFFGEVAVLTHGLRTATVTADCPMKLLRLDERRFRTLLSTAPAVSQKLMQGLAERLKEADEAITS